jgi:hypothetical protein
MIAACLDGAQVFLAPIQGSSKGVPFPGVALSCFRLSAGPNHVNGSLTTRSLAPKSLLRDPFPAGANPVGLSFADLGRLEWRGEAH